MEEEIIKETDKSYLIKKPDGTKVYRCKICGEEFTSIAKLAHHFKVDHQEEKKEDEKKFEEPKKEIILTPEEEILEEMCNTLRSEMEITPGIAGSNKIDWFIKYFRRVKKLQEDPVSLYNSLKRHFPKADDEAIDLIVKSVFKHKNTNINKFIGFDQNQHNIVSFPKGSTFEEVMAEVMKTMLLKSITNQGPDPQTMAILTELKMKTELLQQQLENEKEEKRMLYELLSKNERKPIVSGEGWTDDYARLIAELSNRVFDISEKIIIENKKTRQLLMKYVLPKIIDKRSSHEPSGSGETDDEIIEKIDEELIDEE